MPDKDNPRGNRDASRFGRFSRTASFWILIFLIPLLIINTLTNKRQNAEELTYTAFREQLRNDNIQKVTAADVQKAAATYIQPKRFAVVIAGDRKAIEASIQKLNLGPVRILTIDEAMG